MGRRAVRQQSMDGLAAQGSERALVVRGVLAAVGRAEVRVWERRFLFREVALNAMLLCPKLFKISSHETCDTQVPSSGLIITFHTSTFPPST